MRKLFVLLCLALPALAARNLEIYFIDVEGGQATLIVTPKGESLLVDAGWPGFDGRDANRIAEAARQAGVKRIDYLLVTHYHTDHVGGVPQLAETLPVMHFVDHGENTETGKNAAALSEAYAKVVAKRKRITVKPGDRIPLAGVDVKVVAARGETLGGGAPNPACAAAQPKADDTTENGRSAGFLLTYGKFRFVDLGDLTWNKELKLVCPSNPIGPVDLYLVSHHGMDISNSPALLEALRPRVAIMNNGAKKGGSPAAWKVVRNSPRLEDLWQLHYSLPGGAEANSPENVIANPEPACQDKGIQVSAAADGGFTVTNWRNGFEKKYSK